MLEVHDVQLGFVHDVGRCVVAEFERVVELESVGYVGQNVEISYVVVVSELVDGFEMFGNVVVDFCMVDYETFFEDSICFRKKKFVSIFKV